MQLDMCVLTAIGYAYRYQYISPLIKIKRI